MTLENGQVGPIFGATDSYTVGTGGVAILPESTLLHLGSTNGEEYSDAQLDDYHSDGNLRWRPPVQMTVRARFSSPEALLRGTAGFGFWNDPFGMTKIGKTGRQLPRIRFPQAAWFFFAAQPSDMALAMGVPGFGWKAATIDVSRNLAKALLPVAPLGMLVCRWSWGYRRLWPIAQNVLKIAEARLPVEMDAWHEYHMKWGREQMSFYIDGVELFRTRHSPRGPLGFVAWIDNQFMVATPRGAVRRGVIATREQWMEIASLDIRKS